MSIFIQLLFNGLIAGAIYALVAAGFSLIYSTNKFIHFAHGVTVSFAAYFLYLMFSVFGINFWISVIFTIMFSGILGWIVNEFVYKIMRRRKASSMILLVASVALLILLESLILLFFGPSVKIIDFVEGGSGINIIGAMITPLQIVIILTSTLLFFCLLLFMKKTRLGKAMRAVSNNKDVAEIVGISSKKIYAWSFIIGSSIAGIAGVLISMEQNLEPVMGTNLIIKGFTGSIIGGIGSVPGAIIGAFLLGIIEVLGIWFLPSGYKDAIAFIVLFLFLVFRPQGIFGKKDFSGKII
jgi:branched-chain amino acid transport system permease protein